MKTPALDIDRRRPVWLALSELYLDTQLQASDHQRIADVIVASGYTLDEVEAMLRHEVGPVLGANGRSIAGVWDGFDEHWLTEAILRRRQSWRRFLPAFSPWWMVRESWHAIRQEAERRQGG